MSFWATEKLLQKQALAEIVRPFNPDRVKHGAYELSLGNEASVTSDRKGKKLKLEDLEQLIIPPGQFGLLLTKEVVAIPSDVIGFISIRFSIKCRGLINVSGFHVDPGFKGCLKFAVYNAGSQNIVLTQGDPVFLIWFSDLSQPTTNIYDGEHAGQNGITSDDQNLMQGKLASPAALKKQIDWLKREMVMWRAIFIPLIIALLGLFIKTIIDLTRPPTSTPAAVERIPQNNNTLENLNRNRTVLENNSNAPNQLPNKNRSSRR